MMMLAMRLGLAPWQPSDLMTRWKPSPKGPSNLYLTARVPWDPFEDFEEVKGGKEGLERNPRNPAPFLAIALDEALLAMASSSQGAEPRSIVFPG